MRRAASFQRVVLLGLAWSLAGCGRDIAQTAELRLTPPPAAPLDCTPPATPPALPADPSLGGDSSVESWVLAPIDAYGAGQGPGITLAARDAFRLFVNGHLLATSTESLAPTFVPLTLLPGDNAIAVVVTAALGAPALLAELEELERAYPTDDVLVGPNGSESGWKVSATPGADFSLPTYDDSAWSPALDRGSPDESPTCDPGPGFPAGSDAHFIGAATDGTAVFRLALRIAPIGFGEDTTGGGAVTPVLADNLGDLEAALDSDDPKVVLIPEGTLDVRRTGDDVTDTAACPRPCPPDSTVAMTLNLLPDDEECDTDAVPVVRTERRIDVGSNTTLVGLGRGALLRGGSLDIGANKNVIVRNLALYDVNPTLIEAGDGISIDGADGVWLDHVTFRWISDGFIDATTASQHLTFSWVKNDGSNPAACYERHPRSNELSDTTATIHHTLWQHVDGRAPLATHSEGRVHLFDNVVRDSASYAVGAGCEAEVLVEATTFEDVKVPTGKFTCAGDSDELGLIQAASHGNLYGAGVGKHQSNNADAPEPADAVFAIPYARVLDPAETARYAVEERAGAGSRWALPLTLP